MKIDDQLTKRIITSKHRLDDLDLPQITPDLISPYLALTGLRGFWPMSSFDEGGNARDLGGQLRTLGYNDTPVYGYDGPVPYLYFDGNDYLDRADEAGLDITGTESYVASAAQGLTMGCWFYSESTGKDQFMMAKYDAFGVNQRSYWLQLVNWNVGFCISPDGTIGSAVSAVCTTTITERWYFAVGRFDPSTEIKVWVDNDVATNDVGIPASIHSGTADFYAGAVLGTLGMTDHFVGPISLCFLCAAALSDAIIDALFQETRAAFRV